MLRSLIILLMVAACGQTTVSLGPGSEHLVPDALRATERAFFEGSAAVQRASAAAVAQGRGAAPARGEARAVTSDDLFDFDATPYRLDDTVEVRVTHRAQRRLVGAAHLWVETGAAATRLRYRLPEGLGILHDPIDLRVNAVAGEAAFGLALQDGVGPVQGRVHLGVGATAARVRTSVTSALLDVHHTSYHTEPFLTVGGEVQVGRGRLFAHVREHRDTGYAIITGLGVALY